MLIIEIFQAWESIDTEIGRKQALRRAKLLETMIANECEFMQQQLRQICAHKKELSRSRSSAVDGAGSEVTIEESFADLWKIMKVSIRAKYLSKYLADDADPGTIASDRAARQAFIRKCLAESAEEEAPVRSKKGVKKAKINGNLFAKKRKMMASKTEVDERLEAENHSSSTELKIPELARMESMVNELDPIGVEISIPEQDEPTEPPSLEILSESVSLLT